MRSGVAEFLLKGIAYLLFLELLTLPLRPIFVGLLSRVLPPGFEADWACTALDEVFLFVSFLLAYPACRPRLPYLLGGVAVIEAFNALRILVVVQTGDPLLHDVLFRWGGFLLVLTLFAISFYRLSCRQQR